MFGKTLQSGDVGSKGKMAIANRKRAKGRCFCMMDIVTGNQLFSVNFAGLRPDNAPTEQKKADPKCIMLVHEV
jgi:hypothetical protein